MCIALLSTAHPQYKLILLDNRDEYISRPTAKADFWPAPNSHVLGGRDLLRPIQGTWLGVTRTGRIAVLTNFREDTPPPPTAVSRGEIIKKFLTEDESVSTEDFVRGVIDDGVARDAGGFSLVCGRVHPGTDGHSERLAVISNRARSGEEVPWICGDIVQTVGLSNTHFGDRSWPKVVKGEAELLHAIREDLTTRENKPVSLGNVENEFVEKCFELLSDDELTRRGLKAEDGLEAHILQLRNTILVPALGRRDAQELMAGKRYQQEDVGLDKKPDEIAAARSDEVASLLGGGQGGDLVSEAKKQGLGTSGIYATQKQTVILINKDNQVRFLERTLFDEEYRPVKDTIDMTFTIER